MSRFLIAALAVALAACGGSDSVATSQGPLFSYLQGDAPPVPANDDAAAARGEVLYVQYCATCHGTDLSGEPDWKDRNDDGTYRAPPHDDSGHTWHHSDRVIAEVIARGGPEGSKMPAYANVLSDEDTMAIIEYFKSAWSDEARAFQWQVTWQDQQLDQ